jgi:hypothetical protein
MWLHEQLLLCPPNRNNSVDWKQISCHVHLPARFTHVQLTAVKPTSITLTSWVDFLLNSVFASDKIYCRVKSRFRLQLLLYTALWPMTDSGGRSSELWGNVYIYTVKPRSTNASDREQFGLRTNFQTQSVLDDVLCLELRTHKPSTSWSD